MSNTSSELVEISKLNGDFAKNYGKLIGGYLYLRSINAARGPRNCWIPFLFVVAWIGYGGLTKNGFALLGVERALELVRRSFQIVLSRG
jgi:hypothetical protein